VSVVARWWTCAKKKRAIETLLVEWVEGKPYSRWCEPIAENHFSGCGAMARKIDILRRVTGGANGLGEQNRSLITEEM
jgi:hypothetical protein